MNQINKQQAESISGGLSQSCMNGILGGALAGSPGGAVTAAVGAAGGAIAGGCFTDPQPGSSSDGGMISNIIGA